MNPRTARIGATIAGIALIGATTAGAFGALSAVGSSEPAPDPEIVVETVTSLEASDDAAPQEAVNDPDVETPAPADGSVVDAEPVTSAMPATPATVPAPPEPEEMEDDDDEDEDDD